MGLLVSESTFVLSFIHFLLVFMRLSDLSCSIKTTLGCEEGRPLSLLHCCNSTLDMESKSTTAVIGVEGLICGCKSRGFTF